MYFKAQTKSRFMGIRKKKNSWETKSKRLTLTAFDFALLGERFFSERRVWYVFSQGNSTLASGRLRVPAGSVPTSSQRCEKAASFLLNQDTHNIRIFAHKQSGLQTSRLNENHDT